VTFQKDQVQALIADIDAALQKTTPRLPWVMSGEVTQQRQILERLRNFLVSLQTDLAVESSRGLDQRSHLLAHDIYYQPPSGYPAAATAEDLNAQDLLRLVTQEIGHLRTSLMHPLQADIDQLRQQRDALQQEIYQLEGQRQQYPALPAAHQQQLVTEFMQVLMKRLQDTLPAYLAQATSHTGQLPYGLEVSSPAITATTPTVPVEQIQAVQSRLDQLLLSLDSSLSVVFESLQRNIHAYEASLSQGLEKMHGMGQQGEMMFAALINHLAQQLGREASSLMQSAATRTGLEATPPPPASLSQSAPSAPEERLAEETPVSQAGTEQWSEIMGETRNLVDPFPYAGIELPPTEESGAAIAEVTDAQLSSGLDAAIDAWLRSASTPESVAEAGLQLSAADLEIADLDLSDLDLSQVNLAEVDALLVDLETPGLQPAIVPESMETTADTPPPRSVIASDVFPTPWTDSTIAIAVTRLEEIEDTADIDAELKHLEEQLATLQEQGIDATEIQIASLFGEMTEDSAAFPTQELLDEEEPADLEAFYQGDEFYQEFYHSLEVAEAQVEDAESPPGENLGDPRQDDEKLPISGMMILDPEPETVGTASAPATTPLDFELDLSLSPGFFSDQPGAVGELLAAPGTAAIADLEMAPESNIAAMGIGFEPLVRATEGTTSAVPDLLLAEDLLTQPLPDGIAPTARDRSITPATEAAADPAMPPLATEEQYALASPEEDLLPATPEMGVLAERLSLDETILSNLSEDLSRLENPSQSGFTIDDWNADLSAVGIPQDESALEDWQDASQDTLLTAPATDVPLDAAGVTPAKPESINPTPSRQVSQDFFREMAATPSPQVTPISPPVSAGSPAITFSLENLRDLLEDRAALAAPPVPPSTAAEEDTLAFILEGLDDLFSDKPMAPIPIPPPVATSAADVSEPVLLDPEDDLFASPDSTPISPPILGQSGEGRAPDQPSPFSLEGMDDLFADAPAAIATGETFQPIGTGELPVALFETDSSIAAMPAGITDVPGGVTLQPLGDLATGVASNPPPPSESQSGAAFTIAQQQGLFIEVPVIPGVDAPPALATNPLIDEPDTIKAGEFTLTPMGDLFVEVPISYDQPHSQTASASVASAGTEPPELEMNLDQAFASLLGFLDLPASDAPNIEKKN